MDAATKRQQALLRSLANTDVLLPVKEFATRFSCSEKTIRNDLLSLEKQGVIIERVSGKGIRLQHGEASDIKLVSNEGATGASSTERRRLEIIYELLNGQQNYCSIQSLADKYYVSKTSIVNDFTVIERQLHKYNMSLQKDVHGTKIKGTEMDIRRALVDILGYLLHEDRGSSQDSCLRIDTDTLTELSRHFDQSAIDFVEHTVEEAEKILGYQIVEPYYINLITHILISIERIRSDKVIYSGGQEGYMATKSQAYKAACFIAGEIGRSFKIELNVAEVDYIYRYLVSSGGRNYDLAKGHLEDSAADEIAMEIIDSCCQVFPLKFAFSKALYQALLLHLQPMLNRIRYNIYIKNPMLEQIKTEFPGIMQLLNLIMLKVRLVHRLPPIHEDEIAYLTVYFQDAFEEAILHKNVIIVCSSGVGTSHLLKKRIKNVFPELNIIDVVSAKHLDEALAEHEVDLVITTVHLERESTVPIVYVNAFFAKADEAKVKNILQQQLPQIIANYQAGAEVKTVAKLPEQLASLAPVAELDLQPGLRAQVYVAENLSNGWFVCQGEQENILGITLSSTAQLQDDMIKSIYFWIEQARRGD